MASRTLHKLIIQIPCFNEAATLPATLRDLPRRVPGCDNVEWLVIDDGSTDGTAMVARQHGVDHIVRIPENRGLANAFRIGLDACLRLGADVIVNTDADNQYRGSCVSSVVEPIVDDEADVVIGERPIESVDDFSPLKKRLQRLGSWTVRKFSRTTVRDAASGFRAFSRNAAMRTQVFGKYSYTMETIIQAGWEGLRVQGVDIEVNPATRPSRLVKSIPQYIWRSGTTIVRSFALYKPFRFFFGLGLIPFLISCALMLRWLYYDLVAGLPGSRVPSLVLAAVCLLVAMQVWVFGFLADLLSVNRRVLSDVQLRMKRLENRAEPTRSDGITLIRARPRSTADTVAP